MMTIGEYVKPKSVNEAYELLTTAENASIVGGGFFVRLSSKKIGVAIDLSQAGLEFIRESEESIEIGAMTTFGQLEQSAALQLNFDGVIPAAIANLPGQQMRNMVSVGGTIYGKYGFSELITVLMVLDCRVMLHKAGEISLTDFLAAKGRMADIVEKIVIKKQPVRAAYQMFRNSAGSLPMLTTAVSRVAGEYRIAVGGRPGIAALATKAMDYLRANGDKADSAGQAAAIVMSELEFGGDRRASGEYRRELCGVLVKRAVMEVQQ